MCRRFRRVRRLAQQVVTVTRRMWRVCQCCGNLTAAPQQEVVPLAAIMGNTKAARYSSSTAENKSVSICWNCPSGVPLAGGCCAGTEHTAPVPNTGDLGGKIDSNLDLAADDKCERLYLKDNSPLKNGLHHITSEMIYGDKYSLAQYEFEVQQKPSISTANQSNLVLNLAVDTESDIIWKRNRELSSGHLTLKSKEGPQMFCQSGAISRSSQTDDFVARRFYKYPSFSDSRFSQTDMTLPPESGSSTRFYPLERKESSGMFATGRLTPTIDKVPSTNTSARLEETKSSIGALNYDLKSRNDASIDHFPTSRVISRFSFKSRLSRNDSRLLSKPPNLTVEFAIVKDWYRIYPSSWTMEKNITTTRTRRVDLVSLTENKRMIALKTLRASNSVKESQILIQCQGPYVAQLCACMVQGDNRYLCMTYYTRGDLSKWLEKDEKQKYFTENEAVWIVGYILAAIEFLHNYGILHLDIKSSNTLIDNRGYPVISDFGSAVRMGEMSILKDSVPFTPAYASPEIQVAQKPDTLADLWSVACIFYEIITKSLPHRSLTRCETLLKTAICSHLDVSMMSTEAGDFLTSQLKIAKKERLGFSAGAREVMRHAIFKSVDWDEVKYGSRLMDCRLLRIFQLIEKDQELSNLSDSKQMSPGSNLCKERNNNGLKTCPEFGYADKESYSWSLWEEDSNHMDIVANAIAEFDREKRNLKKFAKDFTRDPT